MKKSEANGKVTCRTPTTGKQPTQIDAWKFDLVRDAILDAIPDSGRGLPFRDLPDQVERRLPFDKLTELGSVGWYTTTVKLELEVRGEIARLKGVSPQHLVRSPSTDHPHKRR